MKYLFKERMTTDKKSSQSRFKMEGINLYFFFAFIIIFISLSIFILYDNWLYQNSYEKLMNIWIQYEDDQNGLDRLTNELTDEEITVNDLSKSMARMREDISKNDNELSETDISKRHPSLVALKKELALLTGDLYKVGKSKDEVIGEMDDYAKNKALLELKEQNIKVFIREEEVVKHFHETLPYNRKIYEGLSPENLLAAIKSP